jgi:hypothetical protein
LIERLLSENIQSVQIPGKMSEEKKPLWPTIDSFKKQTSDGESEKLLRLTIAQFRKKVFYALKLAQFHSRSLPTLAQSLSL